MKRLLSVLLLVVLLQTCAIAENTEWVAVEWDGTLHFPWGITENDTFFEAVDKSTNKTGFEVWPFESPDGMYVHYYFLRANGRSLLDVPVDYVRISPVSDDTLPAGGILADDDTARFFAIEIEFADSIDYCASFLTIYESICSSYGEADSQYFSVETLTLEGEEFVDKPFPAGDDNATHELSNVLSGKEPFRVSAQWYNTHLTLSRSNDKISFNLHFNNFRPMKYIQTNEKTAGE